MSKLARKLRGVGFAATANDVERGLVTTEEVVMRLRRDAPKRQRDNQRRILALAVALETPPSDVGANSGIGKVDLMKNLQRSLGMRVDESEHHE